MSIHRQQLEDDFNIISSNQPENKVLADLALSISTIPRRQFPTGQPKALWRQHITVAPIPFWQQALRWSTAPVALVFLLLFGHTITKQAESSLPGDTLYSVKRASEVAQLSITSDPKKMASLHVTFSERRLQEARAAISQNNPEQKAQALNAFNEQINTTFATATSIASSSAKNSQDDTLLNQLVSLNKEQHELLKEIPASADQPEAKQAQATAAASDKTLAMAIASIHEQSLTDVPETITISGKLEKQTDKSLTIATSTFKVNDDTEIRSTTGETVDLSKLPKNVTIIGLKTTQGLVAKQVIVGSDTTLTTAETGKGQVKGDIIIKPTVKPVPTEPVIEEPVKSTELRAGFIPEPQTPQFK